MQSLGRTTRLLLLLASALALPPTPTQKRRYDLVIYGATGFTGRLAAEYMESRYRKTTVTWALAGRSRESSNRSPEIGADDALPVVETCGRLGTHYVDITGETALHGASAARYDALAKSTGACVVHSCGYDSVPSDLGYLLANDAYRHLHGGRAPSRALVSGPSGGVGGSIYTGLALFGFADELFDDDARRLVAETSGKYRSATSAGRATDRGVVPEWDWLADAWAMPFIMAGANAPVVRKSQEIYGDYVPYDEVEAYAGSRVGAYASYAATATAHMAVEAALGLALGDGGCEDGGVLTPATALGYVLVERLRATGMDLCIEEKTLSATALHYLQAAKG
ncbi:oxidoreductase [Aureococcus anophagefferens]|nr:oxidoreductase [Aureococcus anophagefferens]